MRLPSHWSIKKFEDISEIVTGSTPSTNFPEDYGGRIPFVTPGDLDSGTPITCTPNTLTDIGAAQARILPRGTVFVCCIGATIGKTDIAGTQLATNQQINSLVCNSEIAHPEYVYQYARTLKAKLIHMSSSTTLPIVNKSRFKKIEIPLPPLAEQKRIAAILNQADALRAKRRAALTRLDALVQSVFLAMFGDPVTNPLGWAVGTIGDLADSVIYGTSKKASETGLFPILRMGNITYEGKWDFSDLKYVDLDASEQGRYLVHQGEILFNRTNSKDLVGKTAVYRERSPMAFAGYLIKMIPNSKADPEYVSAFMNSTYTKKFLKEKCRSIVGMANINAQEFLAIRLPIPPISIQQKFGHFVRSVLEKESVLYRNLLVMEQLFSSLQQRAFRGEL